MMIRRLRQLVASKVFNKKQSQLGIWWQVNAHSALPGKLNTFDIFHTNIRDFLS
jgi:hypothetical protein